MGPKQQTIPHAWKTSVQEWLQYLKVAGRSPVTIHTRRNQICHLARQFNKPPFAVTITDIIQIFAQNTWKTETLKGYRNTIHSFYSYHVMIGNLAEDPTKNLPTIRKPHHEPHPCPDTYIIQALHQATAPEKNMIRLAAECGLRRGEIARVNSHDVTPDLLGYSLIVHGKGNKDRIVPLPDDLASIITAAHGWLFPGRWAGHVEESYIGKHISHLLPPGYTAHSLRHRYATRTWLSTHDLYLVSKLLGHESVETTENYVAMPHEYLRQTLKAVRLND